MYKNVILLAVCNAFMLSGTILNMTCSALVGLVLAPKIIYATVPLGISYVSVMIWVVPISLFMQKFGRKHGFYVGAAGGLAGGAIAGLGIYYGSFNLFCLAAVFHGLAIATTQFYRFAATEIVSEEYRSRAISWVLAGGLLAAVMGPTIARFTKDFETLPPFTLSFLSIVLLCGGIFLIIPLISIPDAKAEVTDSPKRPLSKIVFLPAFIVAVLCAVAAYGTMNLLMVAAPLAMQKSHLGFHHIAMAIQWHIIGMFAPSFFTGNLIHRFGVLKIMLAGVVILFLCLGVNSIGESNSHFLFSMMLLGLGWNLLYIGSTTLLTEVYQPAEKGVVQGVNDFMVAVSVALTAAASGVLHHYFGWFNLSMMTIPVLVFSVLGIFMISRLRAGQSSLVS